MASIISLPKGKLDPRIHYCSRLLLNLHSSLSHKSQSPWFYEDLSPQSKPSNPRQIRGKLNYSGPFPRAHSGVVACTQTALKMAVLLKPQRETKGLLLWHARQLVPRLPKLIMLGKSWKLNAFSCWCSITPPFSINALTLLFCLSH